MSRRGRFDAERLRPRRRRQDGGLSDEQVNRRLAKEVDHDKLAAVHAEHPGAEALGWQPPKVLPGYWCLAHVTHDGASYRRRGGQTCIVSAAVHDGKRWVHMSLCGRGRVPSWRELVEAKELFLGDVYAVQVLPPSELYINIHPHVLHLFHCLDGHPLPDFTEGTGSL